MAAPLNALVKKNIPFHWGPEQQKAFDNLKVAFTTALILLHYDPDKQAVVKTDASDYVIAGVFFQYDDNGQLKPVVYFFCKMSPAKCNYEIYDNFFLTIIKIFELLKSELRKTEKPIQIIIDHKNFEYFMSSKFLNRRQARWSEFFSRFNFKITYRPGSLNNKSNVLTRQSGNILKKGDNRRQFQWQTVLKKDNLDIQQLTLGPITNDDSDNSETVSNPDSIDDETVSELPVIIDDAIWVAYSEDERIQEILNVLNTNQRTLKGFFLSETKLVDGQIYFKDKMFVPDVGQLRLRFIQKFHDDPAARHPEKENIRDSEQVLLLAWYNK